jgi:hypothetical protein
VRSTHFRLRQLLVLYSTSGVWVCMIVWFWFCLRCVICRTWFGFEAAVCSKSLTLTLSYSLT